MLYHAYIDESGDRGWHERPPDTPPGKRAGSSRHFAVTALVVPDGLQTDALRQWQEAGSHTGRPPGTVLEWKRVKGASAKRHLLEVIAGIPAATVVSVVLCKWHLFPKASKLTDPEYLYHWPLRLLLERLSWFGENMGGQVAMHLSQVRGVPPTTVRRYVRLLGRLRTSIAWQHLKLPPRFGTPQKKAMLQTADFASAAVYRAFERDEYGYADRSYVQMLKPLIWRRPGRPMWQDGLKYGPWSKFEQPCRDEHPWFEKFCE